MEQREPDPQRIRWPRWGSWLAGAFAIAANVVGVIQLITETSGFLLSLAAGAATLALGGFWLWRLSDGARKAVFAFNLAMVVIGAGVVGFVVADRRRDQPAPPTLDAFAPSPASTSSQMPSPTPDPALTPTAIASIAPTASGPRVAAPSPNAPPTTAARTTTPPPPPPGPFTGNITIRFPQEGWTLAQGQDMTGDVTGWKAGYQVWMSARAEGTTTELVQGPCVVEAEWFTCRAVQLPNSATGRDFLLVAVVTDAVAATLPSAGRLPVETAPDYDQTLCYKG